jgi:hypothetical protein
MPSPNATWSGKPPDFPGKDEKGRWVLQRVTAKVWCHSFFQFTTSILRCLFFLGQILMLLGQAVYDGAVLMRLLLDIANIHSNA